jgi:peptide maturation system acyl carrier-related protein
MTSSSYCPTPLHHCRYNLRETNRRIDGMDNVNGRELALNQIFIKRADIDFTKDNHLAHVKLLSRQIGLEARDLTFILFDIEKRFDVKIPEQAVADGLFDSYENIKSIVLSLS